MDEEKTFTIEHDKRLGVDYLGGSMFAKNEQGNLKGHIATFFPKDNFIVTEPSTLHGDQFNSFIEYQNYIRAKDGLPPLTKEESAKKIKDAVPLTIVEGRSDCLFVIIRPDPENPNLAFQADKRLQAVFPIFRIFFMRTNDQNIRHALRGRGESWRIQPIPRTVEEKRKFLKSNKLNIVNSQRRIYYYNMPTGARYLTYENFYKLNELDAETLRAFLKEIKEYSPAVNRQGYREINFFHADSRFTHKNFRNFDFESMDEPQLRAAHNQLCSEFENAISDPLFKNDDLNNESWLDSMYEKVSTQSKYSTEEVNLGLSDEFAENVLWLPGCQFGENFSIIKDPALSMTHLMTPSEKKRYNDGIPQKILLSYLRESFDIEYANIGSLAPIRRKRKDSEANNNNNSNNDNSNNNSNNKDPNAPKPRRGVYVMQLKLRGEQEERISIIRLQKWGVRENLNGCKDDNNNENMLLKSFNESEKYIDYVLNRRLACHLLGMRLPPSLKVRRFTEVYTGTQMRYYGMPYHTAYFERDYVPGIVTDLIPDSCFANPEFCIQFGRLLGEAAAPNLIVGRSAEDKDLTPMFDDGDEVLILDENKMPKEIIVSEQPGTFVYYTGEFERQIPAYAIPMNKRITAIVNFKETVNAYTRGFIDKFREIQEKAEMYRRTFDDLPDQNEKSLTDRWNHVLDRLRDAKPVYLADLIKKEILLD